MNPQDLGFPGWFEQFRPAQEEAIEHSLTSEKRFTAIGAPPGVGKSGIAYALAKLLGGRTIILTATLGLQDQYLAFPDVADIRGRGNFDCWEGGTCEDGARLGCKDKEGCPYMGAFRRQHASDIVVSSYAYFLAVHEKSMGLRPPDTLICDEAGLAPEWLSRALDFKITEKECREAKRPLKPTPGEDLLEWVALRNDLWVAAEAKYTQTKGAALGVRGSARDRLAREVRKAESLLDRVDRLARLDSNWVISREDGADEGRVWHFECVWPGRYREKLFRGIQRVVLMSATLRPKTLGLLGISREDADFREWGRQFPAKNGPVVWLDTVRVRARSKMSNEDVAQWLKQITYVTGERADRRGLIHTVSYERAKEIADPLRKAGRHIVVNGAADPDSQSAREAFDKFVKGGTSAILCSPSFSTGWDFKGPAAEYQIIAKLPQPDPRSKVMRARLEADPGYADYLCAQELVQACGRVQRSAEDRGETLILDNSLSWFKPKAEHHMPRWFSIRHEKELPKALPKIV